MTKTVAAKITGIALAPGVSKNDRSYTREAIARMVARAHNRISSGDALPLVMKTSHGEDDASKVVGRLTSMHVNEQGAAQFTAEIASTKTGRDIAKLVKGGYLTGVSIRGAWVGKTRTERGAAGQTVETGDDLELHGLDWTPQPGVTGARVLAAESAPAGQIHENITAEALDKAQAAFDAEASALRALDEHALMTLTFETLGAGRTSPAWREAAPAAADAPAAPAPTAGELAAKSEDDFGAIAAAWAGSQLAGLEAARPCSPFMRGITGLPTA